MILKELFKAHNIYAKDVAKKTGYNKNTLSKWMQLDTDEKLPQDFILGLLKHYPDLDLKAHLPTHSKIIAISNNLLGEDSKPK